MAAKKANCAESKKEERYRGGNARRAPDGSTPNAAAIFRQFMDAYTCPFCGEGGFDGDGLKGHLIHEDCEEYRNLKPPARLFD